MALNSSRWLVLPLGLAVAIACGETTQGRQGGSDADGDPAALGGSASDDSGSPSGGSRNTGGSGAQNALGGDPQTGGGGAPTDCDGADEECGSGGNSPDTECDLDEMRCDEDGIPQRCSVAGQWVDQAACSSETSTCVEGVCLACLPEEVSCQGNAPAQCADDGSSWEVEDTCDGETPACLENDGTCGLCAEDSTICNADGDAVLTCGNDGSWDSEEACPPTSPLCVEGQCQECDPDQGMGRECIGDVPHLCVAGQWVSQGACGGETPSCIQSTGRCGCSSGNRCLDGNTPQECSPVGQWVSLSDCAGNLPVCIASSGECGCVEGETRCAGESGRDRCVGGVWTSIGSCSGATPVCDGAGACVACQDGQADRCSADQTTIQECNDNAWVSRQNCSSTLGGICDDGACTTSAQSPNWLKCGDGFCRTDEEICCANESQNAFCSTGSCPAQECGDPAPDESQITCDGPSDCPGAQQCCITTQLDENCPIFPDAVNRIRTRCADECLDTNASSYLTDYEVCSSENGCSNDLIECLPFTAFDVEMYVCDVYSWTVD